MDEFDRIKDKLDSYGEMPEERVWNTLEKRLDAASPVKAASRRPLFRTLGYAAAAVAACLLVVFAIVWNPRTSTSTDSLVVAEPAQEAEEVTVIDSPAGVQAVAENIAKAPVKPAAVEPAAETAVPAAVDIEKENTSSNIIVEESAVSTADSGKETPDAASETVTGSAYPEDWDREEPEGGDEALLSVVSVHSNLGAGLGGNSFTYDGGAMFVSPSDGSSQTSTAITQTGAGNYNMPLTFGAQVQLRFGKLGVGTGLMYTYLHSEYPALVNLEKFTVKNDVSYLGLPVALSYDFFRNDRFSFYGNIGGMVEACVYAGGVYGSTHFTYDMSRPQFSVLGGVGAEYRIGNYFGIYFEPGFIYFINCSDATQPVSIRTAQPMQVRMELGLRIHLNH